MTVRPASRVLFFTIVAVILILAVSVFRPASPLSPEVRAPGHLPATTNPDLDSKSYSQSQQPPQSQPQSHSTGGGTGTGSGYEGKYGGGSGSVSQELLDGGVVMPRLGNETAKAELGRSSWRLLHTMMARFPDEPTAEQQETLRSFVYLFGRLYPCGECASHFQSQLARFPPQISSRSSAAGWACHIHNEVNKMLGKEIFDCSKIGDFYDCGCDHGEEEEGGKKKPHKGHKEGDSKKEDKKAEEVLGPGKVEINDEPPTNG